MASSPLTARVELVGDQEVKAKTKALGDEAAAAVKKLEAAQKASAGVGRDLGAGVDTAKVAITNATNGVRAFVETLAGAGAGLAAVGTGAATAVVALSGLRFALTSAILGFAGVSLGITKAIDDLSKSATAIGLTTAEFQKLTFAAKQVGVDADAIAGAFGSLDQAIRKSMGDSLVSMKEFAALLNSGAVVPGPGFGVSYDQAGLHVKRFGQELKGQEAAAGLIGVAFRNVDGSVRQTSVVFREAAIALSKIPDEALRSKLAMGIFGDKAREIIPYLSQGAAGLAKLDAEFAKIGGGLTAAQEKVFEGQKAAAGRLQGVLQKLRFDIASMFAPFTTGKLDALAELLEKWRVGIEQWVLGAITKATPILEDFFLLLTGQRAAVQTEWIGRIADIILSIGTAAGTAIFGVVIPAFQTLGDIGQAAFDVINQAFGTNWSPLWLAAIAIIQRFAGTWAVVALALGYFVEWLRPVAEGLGLTDKAIGPVVIGLTVLLGLIRAIVAAGLAGAFSPIGLAMIALAGAAAVLYLQWDKLRAVPTILAAQFDIAALQIGAAYDRMKAKAQEFIGLTERAAKNRASADAAEAEANRLKGELATFERILLESGQKAEAGLKENFAKVGAAVKDGLGGPTKSGVDQALAELQRLAGGAQAATGGLAQVGQQSAAAAQTAGQEMVRVIRGSNAEMVAVAREGAAQVGEVYRSSGAQLGTVAQAAQEGLVRVIKGGQVAWEQVQKAADDTTRKVRSTAEVVIGTEPRAGLVDSAAEIGRAYEAARQAVDASLAQMEQAVAQRGSAATTATAGAGLSPAAAGTPEAGALDTAGQQAAGQLVGVFESAQGRIAEILGTIPDMVINALSGIAAAFAPIGEAIVAPFQTAAQGIQQALSTVSGFVQSALGELQGALGSIAGSIDGIIQSVISNLQAAVAAAQELAAAAAEAAAAAAEAAEAAQSAGGGDSGGSSSGFASGGFVSGPGTDTSDSIPAWLSNNEFVVRAAAVRRWGVDLFAALNSLNPAALSMVLRKAVRSGFASGGLVQAPRFSFGRLGFAAGGLVSMPAPAIASTAGMGAMTSAAASMRPMTLVLPGGQKIGGFGATQGAATQLMRAASRKSINGAGRAPGWEAG